MCELPKAGFTHEILLVMFEYQITKEWKSKLVKPEEKNAQSELHELTFISDAHQHIL